MAITMNPFEEWQEEVANSPLVVDESDTGLSIEAYGNCWSFSVSQEQAQQLTTAKIIAFLSAIQQARQQQILDRYGNTHSMLFYCWHDEQVNHLCFSLVSASHNCLPFGSIVKEVNELSMIVDEFLGSPYHKGIPMEEFMTQEEADNIPAEEISPFILPVWSKKLPVLKAEQGAV